MQKRTERRNAEMQNAQKENVQNADTFELQKEKRKERKRISEYVLS